MKEKTPITLSKDLLAEVDRVTGSKQSRSAFIESVLRKFLQHRQRAKIHARDLDLINRLGKIEEHIIHLEERTAVPSFRR